MEKVTKVLTPTIIPVPMEVRAMEIGETKIFPIGYTNHVCMLASRLKKKGLLFKTHRDILGGFIYIKRLK